MQNRVNTFIANNILEGETALLACSGGPDSIALFHLLLEAKVQFSVAHVNYHLRGIDSDKDELFVQKLCSKHNITFHLKPYKFQEEINSIQNEAREVRYKFFNQLLEEYGYAYLITGHHQGDLIENFVFRAIRGTGLNGLTSFKSINKHILRPLLPFSKEDILRFLSSNKHHFRLDDSNKKNTYSRNRIRNKVLPEFEGIFSNYAHRLTGTIERLSSDKKLILDLISPYRTQLHEGKLVLALTDTFIFNPSFWRYLLDDITENETLSVVQACKTKNKGFNLITQKAIISIIDQEVNVINTRLNIGFNPISIEHKKEFEIPINESIIKGRYLLSNKIDESSDALTMDKACIKQPLTFRNPKKGDRFTPLGMKGSKLLSDFFNELKIPAPLKKTQIIIEDVDGQIIACPPYRISNKVKVTSETKEVLIVTLA